MRFLSTSELFDAIYDLSSRSRDAVYVAVAFVGKDSYELFDENIRKVREVKFVVNLSENSVRSGSTNPAGVAQLRYFADVRNRGISMPKSSFLTGQLSLVLLISQRTPRRI